MIYPKNPYCPMNGDGSVSGGNNGNNNMNNNNSNNNNNMNNDNNNMNSGNNNSGNNNNNCTGDNNWNNMTQAELMQYMRELEFAVIDLNLYLDTHPDDAEALEMFTKLAATLNSVKHDYQNKYAPICASDAKNKTPFSWVAPEHKWPWQA